MEYYAFTGDINSLESIGYTAKKLYDRNYQVHKKDLITMHEDFNMAVEINGLYPEFQRNVIKFILLNKHQDRSFWTEELSSKNIPADISDTTIYHVSRFGFIVSREEYSFERNEYMKKLIDISKRRSRWFFGKISKAEAERQISELDNSEFARDTFKITFEFVKQIIELDNLSRLEVFDYDEKLNITQKVPNTIYS